MNRIYISPAACSPLKEFLKEKGFELRFTENDGSVVHDAIAQHPDIYMCQMGLFDDSRIFYGKKDSLSHTYPGDCIYNALCTGEYFIHNLKHTDRLLLETARRAGLYLVNVKQGYARCSCLPVDDTSFITADRGMAKALRSCGASVLLIREGHVLLPGFKNGFIGGCGGCLVIDGKPCIVFNGDLCSHPDFEAMRLFICERGVRPVFFSGFPLTDIGSILTGRIISRT